MCQTHTHYENGCANGKRLSVRKDENGAYLRAGVSMEKFYKSAAPCRSCEKILANEWVPIPETELRRVA